MHKRLHGIGLIARRATIVFCGLVLASHVDRARAAVGEIARVEAAAVSGSAMGEEAARVRILELRRELARHDELYFRKAAPVISDFEYDTLKAELRALEASHPTAGEDPNSDAEAARASPGDDRSGEFATRRHREPMQSLDKAYSDEELRAFHARVAARLGRDEIVYRIEPKYDGLAVCLTFERGRLVRAVTRGNGVEGDDITNNARTLRALPGELRGGGDNAQAGATLPRPEVVEIRGEIYLTLAEFARINEDRETAGEEIFANPRNLAVGSIRLRDAEEVAERRLALVCYGWGAWEPAATKPATLSDYRDALAAWGLPVPGEVRVVAGMDAMLAAVAEIRLVGEARGFPADGVVIKLERVEDQEALGLGAGAPRWAVARKFAPERVSTPLLGITWQVGRTGVVTPVAELAPVELAGSTIARATLHNAAEIARRDLRVGDWVFLEKAGEIIPAIVGVDRARRRAESASFSVPHTCPACTGPLAGDPGRAALRCENLLCPARLARRVAHLASPAALDIDGLGPALVETLVERGLVRTPADLFGLNTEALRSLPGVGERSAEKLVRGIADGRALAAGNGARLLYALGLPGVGKEASVRLAAAFGDLAGLAQADEAALRAALRRSETDGNGGLGEGAASRLKAYLKTPAAQEEMDAWAAAGLGAWTKGQSEGISRGPLVGATVVITGTLKRWTRAQVSELLVAAGARVVTSVTRQTTLLVVGTEAGSNLALARKRGIEVIDEAELARRLAAP